MPECQKWASISPEALRWGSKALRPRINRERLQPYLQNLRQGMSKMVNQALMSQFADTLDNKFKVERVQQADGRRGRITFKYSPTPKLVLCFYQLGLYLDLYPTIAFKSAYKGDK